MKKIELKGYLYLVRNYYDQYDVDEIYFDKDISDIFYENLDWYSKKMFEWRNTGTSLPEWKDKVIKEVKPGKLFVDIIEDKLGLKPCEEVWDHHKDDMCNDTFTFMPDHRKVRITIEEIE